MEELNQQTTLQFNDFNQQSFRNKLALLFILICLALFFIDGVPVIKYMKNGHLQTEIPVFYKLIQYP